MASTIGDFQFITLKDGRLIPKGLVGVDITPPGVDGLEVQLVASRGDRTRLVAIRDFDSVALLGAGLEAYKELQGTFVTIVDDLNISLSNVYVWGVRPLHTKVVASAVGGVTAGRYLAWVEFDVQPA